MRNSLSITKYLLAIYFASYFAFNAAFIHTHRTDNGKEISHAHPFSGKQHSSQATETILLFNTTASLLPDQIQAPSCSTEYIENQVTEYTLQYFTCYIAVNNLRGPPFNL